MVRALYFYVEIADQNLNVSLHARLFYFSKNVFGIENSKILTLQTCSPSEFLYDHPCFCVYVYFFIIIHLFTCAYIVWVTSPSYPCPHHLTPSPPFQEERVRTFLQFRWRLEISNNKKEIAFLLVEISTAIQKDS
jgi:hypothetical protein